MSLGSLVVSTVRTAAAWPMYLGALPPIKEGTTWTGVYRFWMLGAKIINNQSPEGFRPPPPQHNQNNRPKPTQNKKEVGPKPK